MSTPKLPGDSDLSSLHLSPEKEKAPGKNKGGRLRGRDYYCNLKIHIYLTDDEYDLLMAYIKSRSPYDHIVSGAGRRLPDWALCQWDKKGRKELT
jgi:hypothetical protein